MKLAPPALSMLLAAVSTACFSGGDPVTPGYSTQGEIALEPIQEGARLGDVTPGDGVGVFVEYDTGGYWYVSVTCDTNQSDMACEWDVSLTTERGAVPELYSQDALSADDTLETIADGLVLHTVTDYDREGITVVTDPGATLRVEVALDANYSDADPNPEQWIYWVGQDGVARWGASSNPVDFTPTAE